MTTNPAHSEEELLQLINDWNLTLTMPEKVEALYPKDFIKALQWNLDNRQDDGVESPHG